MWYVNLREESKCGRRSRKIYEEEEEERTGEEEGEATTSNVKEGEINRNVICIYRGIANIKETHGY